MHFNFVQILVPLFLIDISSNVFKIRSNYIDKFLKILQVKRKIKSLDKPLGVINCNIIHISYKILKIF